MFGFLKKLFGNDPETNKEAGVQIEQLSAPYKVEAPVVDKVAEVNAKPVVKETAPAAIKAPSKKPATKRAPAKKEAAKKSVGKGGRKPKAK
jgi:hypothetical protein